WPGSGVSCPVVLRQGVRAAALILQPQWSGNAGVSAREEPWTESAAEHASIPSEINGRAESGVPVRARGGGWCEWRALHPRALDAWRLRGAHRGGSGVAVEERWTFHSRLAAHALHQLVARR